MCPQARAATAALLGRTAAWSVDQSVFLSVDDPTGIERLMQYMTRCPFSLSRLVKVTQTGQVHYDGRRHGARRPPASRTTVFADRFSTPENAGLEGPCAR